MKPVLVALVVFQVFAVDVARADEPKRPANSPRSKQATEREPVRASGKLEEDAPAQASVGPFGIPWGIDLAELGRIAKPKRIGVRVGAYSVETPPRPHPDFLAYFVVIGPGFGVCQIAGFSKPIRTSVYGDGLREKFESLRDSLTKKYGSQKTHDYLRAGSIWDEPKDFMMSMVKGERVLKAFWTRDTQADLADGIGAVALEATATSGQEGYVRVTYDSVSASECFDALKKLADEAL